jgi:hypothetical protein
MRFPTKDINKRRAVIIITARLLFYLTPDLTAFFYEKVKNSFTKVEKCGHQNDHVRRLATMLATLYISVKMFVLIKKCAHRNGQSQVKKIGCYLNKVAAKSSKL